MDDVKKFDIDYMVIRRVNNGWIIDFSSNAEFPNRTKMFVFRNLDEMFAWIRQQVE